MRGSVDPSIFQQLQENSVVPLHWASFPFNLNLQALPLCDEQKRPYLGSKFCQEPRRSMLLPQPSTWVAEFVCFYPVLSWWKRAFSLMKHAIEQCSAPLCRDGIQDSLFALNKSAVTKVFKVSPLQPLLRLSFFNLPYHVLIWSDPLGGGKDQNSYIKTCSPME